MNGFGIPVGKYQAVRKHNLEETERTMVHKVKGKKTRSNLIVIKINGMVVLQQRRRYEFAGFSVSGYFNNLRLGKKMKPGWGFTRSLAGVSKRISLGYFNCESTRYWLNI